jgi:DNA-binding CsgD family transcriptional regulator
MDDVLRQIVEAQSLAALWRNAVRIAQSHGFGGLIYYLVRPVSGLPAMAPIHYGISQNIAEVYLSQEFARLDTVPRYVLAAGRPMRWSEVIRNVEMTSEERQFQARNQAAGLGDGISLPCYGPKFCNAQVGLTEFGDTVDFSESSLHYLHCVAQATHLRICGFINAEMPVNRRLSEREKEILLWVARGKSNAVIADLLAISSGTVDTYMRRIYQKLDVADRTSAAVKGVGLGLIAA